MSHFVVGDILSLDWCGDIYIVTKGAPDYYIRPIVETQRIFSPAGGPYGYPFGNKLSASPRGFKKIGHAEGIDDPS